MRSRPPPPMWSTGCGRSVACRLRARPSHSGRHRGHLLGDRRARQRRNGALPDHGAADRSGPSHGRHGRARLRPGDGRLRPAAFDGGSAIASYTANCDPGGVSARGSASPLIVGNLTNGVSYTCTVTATNTVGTGPPSAPSNSAVPSAPVGEESSPLRSTRPHRTTFVTRRASFTPGRTRSRRGSLPARSSSSGPLSCAAGSQRATTTPWLASRSPSRANPGSDTRSAAPTGCSTWPSTAAGR